MKVSSNDYTSVGGNTEYRIIDIEAQLFVHWDSSISSNSDSRVTLCNVN